MLEFGMPTLIENRTLEDNINLCKELGLSFLELNMNFPEYQIDKIEEVDLFYKKADEAGIYYTIHLDENLNIADFNPLVRDAYLETVRRTIEVAKRFVDLKNTAQAIKANALSNWFAEPNNGQIFAYPTRAKMYAKTSVIPVAKYLFVQTFSTVL